ncbi:MAG: nucleotidyltransferase family protein [Bacteroidales bacterium]|jgi:D-glycero-alpha-D-manno-heptose 1-phosphate guanylyltransferase|nr:nucleotidyltransferase family protein [Bacteroidales bacterium]
MITEALILAGGFGTRLNSVVKDVPKPLAPVNGTPFLTILIRYLASQGIKRIILSTGYKYELIQSLYGSNYEGLEIVYAVEKEPLGTGGAIAYGLSFAQTDRVLVTNGDSIIRFSLCDMAKEPLADNEILMLLKPMKDFDRYGSVQVDEKRVTAFAEKSFVSSGLINSGVYLLHRNLFSDCNMHKFSFETDFLEKRVGEGLFRYLICEGYFIDIGIPEDYAAAQQTLTSF